MSHVLFIDWEQTEDEFISKFGLKLENVISNELVD